MRLHKIFNVIHMNRKFIFTIEYIKLSLLAGPINWNYIWLIYVLMVSRLLSKKIILHTFVLSHKFEYI